MDKTKGILSSLSFALVLSVVGSFLVLPVLADGFATFTAVKEGKTLGITVWRYTLQEQAGWSNGYITTSYSPWGVAEAWFGWGCTGHSEAVLDGGYMQTWVTVHGQASFQLTPLGGITTQDIYMKIYGSDGHYDIW